MIQYRPSSLERAFQIYADRLKLKDAEWAQLHSQRHNLSSKLRTHLSIESLIPVGAMARGTAPSPVGCVTLAVIFAPTLRRQYDNNTLGSNQAFDDLTTALRQVDSDTPMHIKTSSILWGGGVLSLRLIPSFRRQDGGIDLIDRSNNGWHPIYMDRQESYLRSHKHNTNEKVMPLLRILHAWSQNHHLSLHTHHLETMAINSLKQTPSSLATGLLKILQKLPNALYAPCLNPCNGNDLSAYLSRKHPLREEASEAAYQSAIQLMRAIDMDAPGNTGFWALSEARSVMGHAFPSITELFRDAQPVTP